MHLRSTMWLFAHLTCSISVCHYRMQGWLTYLVGKSVWGHEYEASETSFAESTVMKCDEIYGLFSDTRNASFDFVRLKRFAAYK